MRPLSAALLVLALIATGCVGKDDGGDPNALESAVAKVTGPTDEELRRTPGSIEGLVLTPDVAPIAGATVTLLRENVTTTTDGGGFFRFSGLANGAYLVSASAEGHRTRTAQATATNGTVYVINLTLEPAPVPTPFVEQRELEGFLSCGLVADAADARHRPACAAADPNHRDTFEVDLLPGGQTVVLELVWDTEANPGAQRLSLHAETVGYGAMDQDLGEIVGEGYARLEIPTPIMEKYYPEGGRYRVKVTLDTIGDAPVGAAIQTSFTVIASAFHHEAAPSGFTALS